MAAGTDIPRWMWALVDDYPYGEPPQGVTPNFENPKLVGYHSLTIGCSICIVLLVFFSGVRAYAKLKLVRKTSIDDYVFIIALPLLLVVLSFYIFLDNAGVYGYHAYDLKIRSVTQPNLVVTFVHQTILPLTTWLIKSTLLCLILSAFRPITWLRHLCYTGIACMFAFYLSSCLVSVIACHPRGGTDRVSWLAGMAQTSCAGKHGIVLIYSMATGVFNILSDFYILIIPLPAISKLKLTRQRKLGVYFIFSAGAIACLMSIVCMVFRVRLVGSHDITVDDIPSMTTNMVEISIGLMISCLAPTAKVFNHIHRKAKLWLGHRFPNMAERLESDTEREERFMELVAIPKKRKHQPGGLSEIDSMKTLPSIFESENSKNSTWTDHTASTTR